MVARLDSINIGVPAPNPYKQTVATGIDKHPHVGPVEVRAPGPKQGGVGSGVVGDFIGDSRHHGGDDQALYVFQREDLDRWQVRLGRDIPNGFFGENLTTTGLDVNGALIGETWRISDTVVVQVTYPRLPCSTFRGWVGEKGWLKRFTEDARPGAYLRIVTPGTIRAGDTITVLERPTHGPTVSTAYLAELGLA
ncbi:MAG: MOSC domain-containing protein [Rhodoglobus sp.]